MSPRQVCILGGSGFVGTRLAERLSDAGVQVVVPTRFYERARHLLVLPTVDVIVADIHDESELRRVIAGSDAVVNLVGALHPENPGGYDAPHVDLPRSVVRACAAAGITRLLHMSALCADTNAPSEYLRSRAHGETAVWETAKNTGVRVTVFRPSIVFGRDDRFLNMFASLVRMFPVIPLGSAQARFQPIHVEDLVSVLAACLTRLDTAGQTYSLCGPTVYTLRELIDYVAFIVGKRRPIVELGAGLSMLQAFVFEHLPGKLITRDNVRSMSVPNVCAGPFPAAFGFQPAPMEAIVPRYLADELPRERHHGLRRMIESQAT
jgi:uncharacterized protein YbjT (DUF2867 family)